MSSPAVATAPAAAPAAKKGIDPRILSSSLLTLVLLIGQWQFQILGDYKRWMLSLAVSFTAEIVLSLWLRGKFPNLLSAYISGNSVVILLKPAAGIWWPFWCGALISIVSKYVVTWHGNHLWNPTNFVMCLMMLLAPSQVTLLSHEWGNTWWTILVIWSIGLLVVTRARVWHLTLTYAALFVLLAWVRTLFNGLPLRTEIAPITGAMYTLFMFFMITDPRTVVPGRTRQLWVVLAIALVECAIRMARDFELIASDNPLSFAPPMYALFIVGPIAMFHHLQFRPTEQKAARAAN